MSDWTTPVNGFWSDSARWTGGVPNAAGAIANFTVPTAGNGTALILFSQNQSFTVGTLNFATTATQGWFLEGDIGVTSATLHLSGAGGGPAFINATTNGSVRNTEISDSRGLRLFVDSDLIVTTSNADTFLLISAPMTGNKDIYKFGSGALKLEGANGSMTGDFIVSAGRLEAATAASMSGGGTIKLNNNAIFAAVDSSFTVGNNIELASPTGSGNIVAGAGKTLTLTGQLELRANFFATSLKFGSATDNGTIVLSGTSLIHGTAGVDIAGGTVQFGTAGVASNYFSGLYGTSPLQILTGATLDTGGFVSTINNMDLDGGTVRSTGGALNLTSNQSSGQELGTIIGTAQADRVVFNIIGSFTIGTTNFTSWSTNDQITLNLLVATDATGSTQNETINGSSGNDVLVGGGGIDTIRGGAGSDVYQIADTLSTLIENPNEGTDTIIILNGGPTVFTLATNFENLTFLGTVQHAGAGNAADNVLTGGQGRDQLDGRDGNDTLNDGGGAVGNEDTLLGGTGNDLYIAGLRGTSTIELAGEGIDEVRTAQPIYELQPNIENLTMTDNATHGGVAGNELANVIRGGTGGDDIFGRAGNDTLFGGSGSANTMFGQEGDDIYMVDATGDSVIEFAGEGADMVMTGLSQFILRDHVEALVYTGTGTFLGIGGSTNNTLVGGANADTLSGLDGDDLLIGGSGNDQLQGGNGADLFRYRGGETGLDRILDFQAGIDKLQVASAFFNPIGTLQFVSGPAAAASSANSTFLYDTDTGIVSFDRDGNGAGAAVQLGQLNQGLTLTVNDFGFF